MDTLVVDDVVSVLRQLTEETVNTSRHAKVVDAHVLCGNGDLLFTTRIEEDLTFGATCLSSTTLTAMSSHHQIFHSLAHVTTPVV
ncbi:hypothetical protein D3C73_1289530 [compost metagenome]